MAVRPLFEVYAFKEYQTREEYEAETHKPCPSFDNRLPVKKWFDPRGLSFTSYAMVARDGNGVALKNDEGKPYIEAVSLPRFVSTTVNIPFGSTNAPTSSEVIYPPIDLTKMKEGESLIFFGIGAPIVIWDGKGQEGGSSEGFTTADRQLLKAIAKKVGV